MFDQTLIFGAIVMAITFAAAISLSRLTGLDPTVSLVGFAAAVWGYFYWLEVRSRPDPADVPTPIWVDWAEKRSETEFGASADVTRQSLEELGLTPETALGMPLIFATQSDDSNEDIYFEGTFVRADNGEIIIRATEPV